MITVVRAPASVMTVVNISLRSVTIYVVKPDVLFQGRTDFITGILITFFSFSMFAMFI